MRRTNPKPHAQNLLRGLAPFALLACACLASILPPAGALAQQPPNANANTQGQPAKPRAKRVTPLRASDSGKGSRVTITSDAELSDYSAYRSGDRFVVVIPQAQGGGDAGAKGRGFDGAQVTRRGNDLVYTFKLQPGATAKVNQHFNRLDVQFTAPKNSQADASANATPAPTPRAPTETAAVKPTPTPNATATKPGETKNATPGVVPPVNAGATKPNEASPAFPSLSPAPSTVPPALPTVSPSAAPAPSVQIAQAVPTQAAPVSIVAPSTGATSTLGAAVARNWHWIVGALLLFGVGLLLVARFGDRGDRQAKQTTRADATSAAHAIKEVSPAAALRSVAPTSAAEKVATAATLAAVAADKTKKDKKGKKHRAAEARAAAVETPKPPAVEAKTTPAPATAKPADAQAKVGTPPMVASPVAAKPAALAAKEIAPAVDSVRVGEETRKLLAGEAYDERVVNAPDSGTREMVSSELLAALASRNSARNERARTAIHKHGYFEDATRDLQSAEAPAQRAAAARTLSLLRDRAATPHLVAALNDPSADVRRASVEALAELKDPSALEPLEALRWRETSRQVPRALIQRAVEASTAVAEETTAVAEETEDTLVRARETAIAPAHEPQTDVAAIDPASESLKAGGEAEAMPPLAPVAGEALSTVAAQDVMGQDATSAAPRAVEEPEAGDVTVETPAVAREQITGIAPYISDVTLAASREEVAPPAAADDSTVGSARSKSAVSGLAAEPGDAVEATHEIDLFAPAAAASPASETETASPAAQIYTFDEGEASSRPARGASGARRGTGGLEFGVAESAAGGAQSPHAAPDAPVYVAPEFADASGKVADDWLDVDVEEQQLPRDASVATEKGLAGVESSSPSRGAAGSPTTHGVGTQGFDEAASSPSSQTTGEVKDLEHVSILDVLAKPSAEHAASRESVASHAGEAGLRKELEVSGAGQEDVSIIPKSIQLRLESEEVSERASSVRALARLNTDEAFRQICAAFDDPAQEVRDAAARALNEISDERAENFTRALRESPAERRRQIGASLATSGLAGEAVSQLTGESRERTYDAFSLLFLMAKAGETAPLVHAIESHPDTEVRLAVVKLLALSGQQEVLPSFKRLAVRGSLPAEVRSAVMEAIYQLSSAGGAQNPRTTPTV